MAKTRLRKKGGARKGVHFRKVASYVDVGRVPAEHVKAHGGPFIACVKVGGGAAVFAACANGRNPRKAVAAAMRKAASLTARRRGAFAGLGRR